MRALHVECFPNRREEARAVPVARSLVAKSRGFKRFLQPLQEYRPRPGCLG